MSAIKPQDNPLLWWISHQNKFPRLNLLAQHYLGISGTSVCSERMFSGAGMVASS